MRFGKVWSHRIRSGWRAGASLVLLVVTGCSIVEASGAGDDPQPATPIDDVVMYAVDEDSDELLRYAFGDDDYFVVGQIVD